MPIFDFLKKRSKSSSNIKRANHYDDKSSTLDKQEEKITLDEAIKELSNMEKNIVNTYMTRLQYIFEDINQVYNNISYIADSLDSEDIVTEEEKLTPLVKNTKNTIVKALKRESSNTLPIPETYEDFTKFKDSVDASINRFGEVTSTHSRIVHTFMKKHANNLRSELKKITEYSDELKQFHSKISQKLGDINECRNNLSLILEKAEEIQELENSLNNIKDNISFDRDEITRIEKEIGEIKMSDEFERGLLYKKRKEEIEKEKNRIINELSDISNHLSKAGHKYSYGISKGTIEKIQILINNPSKILIESDIFPYIKIVNDIKESISNNKISLKDSSKVIQYCDLLVEELPKYKVMMDDLNNQMEQLKDKDKIAVLDKLKKSENDIESRKRNIEIEISRDEETKIKKFEMEEKLKSLLKIVEDQMFDLLNKRFKVQV